MPVVLVVVAAVVIVAAAVVVATGRGGELARQPSRASARMQFRTAADVARYRPPAALLGYQPGATQHALALIARTMADRDAEIDRLRRLLGLGPASVGATDEPAGSPDPESPSEQPVHPDRPGPPGWQEPGWPDSGRPDSGWQERVQREKAWQEAARPGPVPSAGAAQPPFPAWQARLPQASEDD